MVPGLPWVGAIHGPRPLSAWHHGVGLISLYSQTQVHRLRLPLTKSHGWVVCPRVVLGAAPLGAVPYCSWAPRPRGSGRRHGPWASRKTETRGVWGTTGSTSLSQNTSQRFFREIPRSHGPHRSSYHGVHVTCLTRSGRRIRLPWSNPARKCLPTLPCSGLRGDYGGTRLLERGP